MPPPTIPTPAAASATTTTILKTAQAALPLTAPPPPFTPRRTFDVSPGITRSYFLGHHQAALSRMRKAISDTGLIIECRDFRVPVTSWNPLLESHLAETERIIVYTHRDLGPDNGQRGDDQRVDMVIRRLRKFHAESKDLGKARHVLFLGLDKTRKKGGGVGDGLDQVMGTIKSIARESGSLTGMRGMIVGMPNAGKSMLLNRLRHVGMSLPKAAKTGQQPGVTRKLSSPVRIAMGEGSGFRNTQGLGEGVYMLDTPGVFVPYVSDPESMLKLALVGCVRDGLVSPVTVADYLLYHMNLKAPGVYTERFMRDGRRTNDVHEFLEEVARRTGKLTVGGEASLEQSAAWVVQEWRNGKLGRFLLDVVNEDTLKAAVERAKEPTVSMNQAKKREKVNRKLRNEMKRAQGGLVSMKGDEV